jgi:murein DD-endopeptidase MepM/ murein hydrolase activator NlpD
MRRFLVVAAATLALLTGTASAAQPPVLGFTISSGPRAATAQVSLPSATVPNNPGGISVPVSFTTPPASPQLLDLNALHQLWQRAGAAYGIPWNVLAAINKVESNFGQNMGPSSAGAIGWMQFMPSTWLRWGTDADGDGVADPWDATDAVYSAARYLAASGGQSDISRAVFSYNHADWYVREVLDLARVYGNGTIAQTADLQQLQQALSEARARVVAANRVLVSARERERSLQSVSARLHAHVDEAALLSDRLAAERRAVQFDVRIDAARSAVDQAEAVLEQAQSGLDTAQQRAEAPSFTPAVGSLMGAPSYNGQWVFPVGGGPEVVSAAHTHPDYPAVDIAAPQGSPVYAISNAVVLNAWHEADPRCGIGMTIRTEDGQTWTYCHLAVLYPSVTDGVSLAAGTQIGLVGMTGHATGPHLHLQLQPPTSYPQYQPWFQSFAGKAFRWQDAPTPMELPGDPPAPRVFTVVPETRDGVVAFTRSGG